MLCTSGRRRILGEATLGGVQRPRRAMLLTAPRQLGVILSQIVRGFAEAIAESGADAADAQARGRGARAGQRAGMAW